MGTPPPSAHAARGFRRPAVVLTLLNILLLMVYLSYRIVTTSLPMP